MTEAPISVEGLALAKRALAKFSAEANVALKASLREAGELVRAEAEQRFDAYDAKSALGYRVYLRAGRVDVEQTLPRVTGKRPDYGALQMRRALVPALNDKKDEIVGTVEAAMTLATERI